QGVITQQGGVPIEGAVIEVLNTSTGARLQAVTRANGRYFLENVTPGGPYRISARAIGFRGATLDGIRLTLGQRFTRDFELERQVVEVEEVTVAGAVNPLINTGRTGSAQSISELAIQSLPLIGRNITSLIVTAPQVSVTNSGGPSIGGQNNRLNNIQIDGAVNNDLFGLGSTGTPGGQAQARAISSTAVKEFQVLVAPYDVRQGSFTGGLVNAVTRSGDNQFRGSVFGVLQNETFVGDIGGVEPAEFSTVQYGGTLSGPILKDRLHYFAAVDLQDASRPFVGPTATEALGVDGATDCQQVIDAVAAEGYNAGGCGDFTIETPNPTVFGKVDWSPAVNNRVTLSYNRVSASDDVLSRRDNGDWLLTGGTYSFESLTNALRLNWAAVFSDRFSNDLILGYQTIRDDRAPDTPFPTVRVTSGTGVLVTGAERFSQANELDQDIFEVTDNLTFDLGRHRVTVGTHNEFFSFRNVFFPRSIGEWTFTSPDSLTAGLPTEYRRNLELRPGGGTAEFDVTQWGFYAQDQFNLGERVTMTAGLRVDIPTFGNTPPTNPGLQDSLGVDTGAFPSGNALWSPRVGLNYDVFGDGTTFLRGGIGIFSGRPAYVWMSNAFTGTGLETAEITCRESSGNLPAYTLDPSAQYDTCAGGGAPSPPRSTPAFFDEDFKFQQNMKAAIGLDQQLPWSIVGTVDLVYTKWVNSLYIEDINLAGPQGSVLGEAGRITYGVPGSGTPTRVSDAYNAALRHHNKSEDRSYQATFQLQKRFSDNLEFNAGYTYSNAKDVMALTSSIAFSNYGFATLDGTIADRNLTTSSFDRPHKVTISGTVQLPARLSASLVYIGSSGSPYAYVVNGDINSDGVGGTNREFNDLFYVPTGPGDFTVAPTSSATYADLENYIATEHCLSSQRGRVMERNSCRNPWFNLLNARLSWDVSTFGAQGLELRADIFNLLNLIDGDWGLQKETSSFEGGQIVRLRGYDAANQRGIYDITLPTRDRLNNNLSRWAMQLGVSYNW
ncbi:MAG TPA: TonB-dependent receptor, partial [Gemmatimonadales bacterium]|nr:TonB-dependent receptor [Gemmatimonadales bacterium]